MRIPTLALIVAMVALSSAGIAHADELRYSKYNYIFGAEASALFVQVGLLYPALRYGEGTWESRANEYTLTGDKEKASFARANKAKIASYNRWNGRIAFIPAAGIAYETIKYFSGDPSSNITPEAPEWGAHSARENHETQ